MAIKSTYKHAAVPTNKQRPVPTAEARGMIEQQTALFLQQGGAINKIPQGVSGQPNLTNHKHIVISKKPTKKVDA